MSKAKLISIFSEVLQIDEKTLLENETLDSYDSWDSLAFLRLIPKCESQFGIKLPIKEVMNAEKIMDIYRFINKKEKENVCMA